MPQETYRKARKGRPSTALRCRMVSVRLRKAFSRASQPRRLQLAGRAQQVCSSQLAACAQDATCNAAIAGALNCVAEGGEISQCLPFAVMNGDDDTALGEVQGCTVVNNDACPCLTTPPATPPAVVDADLPLCSCKTVPPNGNAMSCRLLHAKYRRALSAVSLAALQRAFAAALPTFPVDLTSPATSRAAT